MPPRRLVVGLGLGLGLDLVLILGLVLVLGSGPRLGVGLGFSVAIATRRLVLAATAALSSPAAARTAGVATFRGIADHVGVVRVRRIGVADVDVDVDVDRLRIGLARRAGARAPTARGRGDGRGLKDEPEERRGRRVVDVVPGAVSGVVFGVIEPALGDQVTRIVLAEDRNADVGRRLFTRVASAGI